MNIVQVRSPFKIIINEPTQLLTQVKLYIWNQGDTEPTTPTYPFSKAVPSIASRECVFNISNQLQEFINPISAVITGGLTEENPKSWCFFKVERYSGTSDKDFTLLDTTNYIGLNGFTDYMDGNQVAEVANYKLLTPNINYNYEINNQGYFNLLVDIDAVDYQINYGGSGYNYYIRLRDIFETTGVFLLQIPYAYTDNVNYRVSLYDLGIDETLFRLNSEPIEECKYTPVVCTFQNSLGGWQFLTFFKAQTNSINVKGSEFNLLPNKTDYNPLRGQSKVFNLNGNQSVKLNTGWVDENYDVLIRDLLLSETVLLDNKPVMVKTKSMTYKTSLKDKMINYEIDFEYSFDLINNIV